MRFLPLAMRLSRRSCQDFFFDAKREKKTIILVTHSMDAVKKYCNKAILIKDGENRGKRR